MKPARGKRESRTAEVLRTERITPNMVRVILGGPDLASLPELPFTDHYIKLIFAPEGASYAWPFDPDTLRETEPPESRPVTRTYTIRSFDRDRVEMAVDFVVHGDHGLAGPWADRVQPGELIGFYGPGGAYVPEPDVERHLLVGDEAALPAIAAALDRLPETARADVFLEVAGPAEEVELRRTDGIAVTWVHRGTRPYGTALAAVVRAAGAPGDDVQAFVHGNADLVRDLRRFLFVESRLDRHRVSISGYWRAGYNEDRWQATKSNFNQAMEAEEAAVAG